MTKHRQQNKSRPTNRMGTSISIDPEVPGQIQEQGGAPLQSPPGIGFTPAYEEIQRRAYRIHEEKGGGDLENWLEAERTLKEEYYAQQK